MIRPGRARRQLYLEEFSYRFNRRHLGTPIADRLLATCIQAEPYPYGARGIPHPYLSIETQAPHVNLWLFKDLRQELID